MIFGELFGKKREMATSTAVIPEEVETAVPLQGVTTEPDMTKAEMAEYLAVATRLGLENSPALVEEKLCHFLVDENIREFDLEQAVDFLDAKLGKGDWEWRGVRIADVGELKGWHMNTNGQEIPFGKKQYSQPIPLPVLLTIEKIAAANPAVYFYASSPNKENEEDPFLLVTSQTIGSYVVERWDEPDFRQK